LSLAKFPERIWNDAVPGDAFHESDAQGSRLAERHALGACSCLIDLLKNPPRILHETFSRRADLHAAWKAVKQLETDLLFQILNLSGKRGLRDAQTLRGASVMLLLCNLHEVSQVPKFHSDTLWLSVR